jgi:hypothetical protein
MPLRGTRYDCPVCFCIGCATNQDQMRQHFSNRHLLDIIIIKEEGLLPQCVNCKMFVPNSVLANHPNTIRCQEGAEQNRKWELDASYIQGLEAEFLVNEDILEPVSCFQYLGCPVTCEGNDFSAVLYNIAKAWQRWAQVSKVLSCQGADTQVSGYFYKVIVQSVLLYGCETWAMTQQILGLLEGFHHQVARWLCHQTI